MQTALQKTKMTKKVIFVSECSYMKAGLKSLLRIKADELGIEIQYQDYDYNTSIIELIAYCRKNYEVILLCDTRSKFFPYLFEAFRTGVATFKGKKTHWISRLLPGVTDKLYHDNSNYISRLSAVENQIIKLLMRAWKPKQISEVTGLDVKKISFYKRNAMKKMGAATSHELFQKYYGNSKIKNIAILSDSVMLHYNSHSAY